MSDSQFLQIPFDEILKRIKAGATVITPNRRLALALKEKFDQQQITQGTAVWGAADILPFSALIERIYFASLYAKQASAFPFLLSMTQEQLVWEAVIQSSEAGKALLRVSQTAQWVREAWQLAHAWQLVSELQHFFPNEDAKAFLDWAKSYQQITQQHDQTDHARICDLIIAYYERLDIKKPAVLICFGFDVLTPQLVAFLNKLTETGCDVVLGNQFNQNRQPEKAQRLEFLNSQEEIYQAAVWARTRIEENPAAQVGIVVPALARYRNAIIRMFYTVMCPDVQLALPGTDRPVAPFNVSLGLALTTYPMVDAALVGLELLTQEMEFNRVSHWFRSPFLAGAETEMEQRALLDARLRRYAEPTVTLDQLMLLLQRSGAQTRCPMLMHCLLALIEFRQEKLPKTAQPSAYAKIFAEVLQMMGFPGERSLNSIEYQTLRKWQELVAELATFDQVISGICYGEAVSRLKQMARDTLFQPETPKVPIQILGVLEAAGMVFDHLWVMGLSEEQWPLRSNPNPFLPLELQRSVNMPLGSIAASLAYSQRLTDGWLASAAETIFSYPKFSDDRDGHELKPSSLIEAIPQGKLLLPAMIRHRDLIFQSAKLEQIEDYQVLPLHHEATRRRMMKGGASVIKDYAACPFRAWVRHRLHVKRPDKLHAGLNAMERGVLVHQVLATIWEQLKDQRTLAAISDDNLNQMLGSAAEGAILQMQQDRPGALVGRFAQIEKRRLIRLIREWLCEEKEREPFTVVATEAQHSISIGDLVLNVRLDRVDELEDGRQLVIDYKTNKQSIQMMLGERMDEPQLPLYLVMTEIKQAAGVAFATVKLGEMGFTAIVQDQNILPGVKSFTDTSAGKSLSNWEELLVAWRQNLLALAEGFASGDAKVDPKNYPSTCEYCDVQIFCRIQARLGEDPSAQECEND